MRPAQVLGLAVAARGAWRPSERRAAGRRLGGLARRTRVVADVEAALHGALGDQPGILLLAGTGSIALGRDARGRVARAGGLGPLVGDEGSAFWIGREWLRRAAGPDAARRLARRPDAVARIAALAPAVLRRAVRREPARRGRGAKGRRDAAVARVVVRDAQRHLAALVVEALRALRLREPAAVSWAGGLLRAAAFRRGVWRAARSEGARLSPAAPRDSALRAALAMAREEADRTRSTAGGSRRARPDRAAPRSRRAAASRSRARRAGARQVGATSRRRQTA